ncbi:hypothetical protein HDU67_003006 [Dinochytrium kinnereticum]|nr:hypothetical protein HDU67_003006 [Dinochytrium kinnereticum]
MEKKDEYGFRNDAVYFLSPTLETIEHVMKDFEKGNELYPHAHFYFTSPLTDELFDKLTSCVPNTVMETCLELNLDFLPLESRVFHFNMPNPIDLYKSQSGAEVEDLLSSIAKKFRGVLYTLNEDPVIRFYDPSDTKNNLSARLARKILAEVQDIKKLEKTFPSPTPFDIHGPATVLIVDRTMDIITPLIHSYGYQAMIYDSDYEVFEDITDGVKRLIVDVDENGTKAVVDESDEAYVKMRHESFHTAKDIYNVLEEEARKYRNADVTTIHALKSKVFKKDENNRKWAQLDALLELNYQLNTMLIERGYLQMSEFENYLIMGENTDHDDVRVSMKDLKELLLKNEIEHNDKLRILALYVVLVGGLKPENIDELGKAMECDAGELSVIKGLAYLGVNPAETKDIRNPASPFMYQSRKQKGKEWSILNFMKKSDSEAEEEEPYDRYQPALSYIIDDHLNGKSNFSILEGSGQYRSAAQASDASPVRKSGDDSRGKGVIVDFKNDTRPVWARKRIATEGGESESYRHNGARLIILAIGGLSHAEIRAVYLAAKKMKREIIIGSTNTMTPHEYLEALHELGKLEAKPFVYPQYLDVQRLAADKSNSSLSSPNKELRGALSYSDISTPRRSEEPAQRQSYLGSSASQKSVSVSGQLFSSSGFSPSIEETQTAYRAPSVQTVASTSSAGVEAKADARISRPSSVSSVASSSYSNYQTSQPQQQPISTASSSASAPGFVVPPRTSVNRHVPKPPPEVVESAQMYGQQTAAAAQQRAPTTAAPIPTSNPSIPPRGAFQNPSSPPYSSPAASPVSSATSKVPGGPPRSPFTPASTLQSTQAPPPPPPGSNKYFGQPQATTNQPGYHQSQPQPAYAANPQGQAGYGGGLGYSQSAYAGGYNQNPQPAYNAPYNQPPPQPTYGAPPSQSQQPAYVNSPYNAPQASYAPSPSPQPPQQQYQQPAYSQASQYHSQPPASRPKQAPLVQLSTTTYNATQQQQQYQGQQYQAQPSYPSQFANAQHHLQHQSQPQPNFYSAQGQFSQYAQPQPQHSYTGQQPPAQGYNYQTPPPQQINPGYTTAELQAMHQRGQLRTNQPQQPPPSNPGARRY